MKTFSVRKMKGTEYIRIKVQDDEWIESKEVGKFEENYISKTTEFIFFYKDYISFIRLFQTNIKDMLVAGKISQELFDFITNGFKEYSKEEVEEIHYSIGG